jgi:hypothetical protein
MYLLKEKQIKVLKNSGFWVLVENRKNPENFECP